jgi:hypothetical protein
MQAGAGHDLAQHESELITDQNERQVSSTIFEFKADFIPFK